MPIRSSLAVSLLAVAAACAPRSSPTGSTPAVAGLPPDVAQLIVSIAPDWDAPAGSLQCFERSAEGWHAVSPVVPALYGREGLAWGRGLLPIDEPARAKREGDGRAPAGVFALGAIYGDDPSLPAGADYPYHQVTEADAWIEDPALPDYNRHVVVDPADPPPWFESQRMRRGDPAFRWRVEVRHNAENPIPGAGSAIFLHIRRGPDRATAGCTALREEDLAWIVGWLRADKRPHFVLLPADEYERRRAAWGLPQGFEPLGRM